MIIIPILMVKYLESKKTGKTLTWLNRQLEEGIRASVRKWKLCPNEEIFGNLK